MTHEAPMTKVIINVPYEEPALLGLLDAHPNMGLCVKCEEYTWADETCPTCDIQLWRRL